jgi:hypothetical protein
MTEIVERQEGVLRAKVMPITSFRALTSHAAFRRVEHPMSEIVERQKGVGITPLLPYNKVT